LETVFRVSTRPKNTLIQSLTSQPTGKYSLAAFVTHILTLIRFFIHLLCYFSTLQFFYKIKKKMGTSSQFWHVRSVTSSKFSAREFYLLMPSNKYR